MSLLEDEFGDVVWKARTGLGLSTADLAAVAGLAASDMNRIESYEFVPSDESVAKLARALHLRPDALLRLARNKYYPEELDLSRWGNVHVICSKYSGMMVNAYLVWCADTRQAVLLDTGCDAGAVERLIQQHRLTLAFIGLTHTHGDHIAVLEDLRKAFDPVVLASPNEPVRGAKLVSEGDSVSCGSLQVRVLETEGHSRGGLTFVVRSREAQAPMAAVGDALFAGSAGGAGFNYQKLIGNLHNKVFALPDDTLLLPGHGPVTTVASEKLNNPFAPL